jgi:hypothetical protein
MPAAVAQTLNLGYPRAEYSSQQGSMLRDVREPACPAAPRFSGSQPQRHPISINISKRLPQVTEAECNAPFCPPSQRTQTPLCSNSESTPLTTTPRQDSAPHITGTSRDASDMDAPKDMSNTLFMRLFRAHGGMCTVRSLTEPVHSQTPSEHLELSAEEKAKTEWQATCKRVLAFTTSKQKRAYIEEEGVKHPPPPELPRPEARCYSPVSAGEPMVPYSANQHPAVQAYALRQAQMSQAVHGPIQTGNTPTHLSYTAAHSSVQVRHSRMTAARAWSSAIVQSVVDHNSVSSRVASVYERLQGGQAESPRKRQRCMHPCSPTSCSPASDALGGPWESKPCTLCGGNSADFASTCCGCVSAVGEILLKAGTRCSSTAPWPQPAQQCHPHSLMFSWELQVGSSLFIHDATPRIVTALVQCAVTATCSSPLPRKRASVLWICAVPSVAATLTAAMCCQRKPSFRI